jgi:hypothetical protein
LSNSLGFGGHNAALVIKKFKWVTWVIWVKILKATKKNI